jgi:adenylate cyclase
VNQMVGDGLMAMFGAPLPLPDSAGSAAAAAREMIEMIDLFNLERGANGKAEIRIGIGIATGAVVAGYTGTHQRATYTCVGDTVNLAARLEAHTKEAQRPILLDAATRAGLPPDAPVEALGEVQLKGKAAPVQVFALSPKP